MAKDNPTRKKPADAPARDADNPNEPPSIRSILKGSAILLLVGLLAWGYLRTRDHVARTIAFRHDPPQPVLKDRPIWMSDGIARRIIAKVEPEVAHSAFDHQLLVTTASILTTDPDCAPWIRKVNSVRRVYDKGPGDVIEIDCDYRAPVAVVRWHNQITNVDEFCLVDGDATLLPEVYTAADVQKVMYDQWKKPILRTIEGISNKPPGSAGQRWRGDDLAAGIEMAKLLHEKPCADEIERINVANFKGRLDVREAQIVLMTRYQTQVRWGRPVSAKDFFVEVSPAQKLLYMEQLVQKFGRVDARHSAVDLRFDIVTFPASEAIPAGASASGFPDGN